MCFTVSVKHFFKYGSFPYLFLVKHLFISFAYWVYIYSLKELLYQTFICKCFFLVSVLTVILMISSGEFVVQSCLTLCNPMDCSMPGFLVLQHLLELAQTHVHWVNDAFQPSHSFFLLPSTFPSIRVFSNDLALWIRWPKYWSFIFSISPSNKYSGLIYFRIDWFRLFAVEEILKSFLQHHVQKH